MLHGDYCFTANMENDDKPNPWSHDEVYRQNPLLEEAVGTKDDPKKEIMEVTQGSGKRESRMATKQRQAKYNLNKAARKVERIKELMTQPNRCLSQLQQAPGHVQRRRGRHRR